MASCVPPALLRSGCPCAPPTGRLGQLLVGRCRGSSQGEIEDSGLGGSSHTLDKRLLLSTLPLQQLLPSDGDTRAWEVNAVINIINESGDFKSICLSGSIIAEDSTAEEQSRSIIASFGEAGQLLHEWKDVTLKMFPRRQDLIDMIPDPSDMSPTKLLVVVWCQRIPAKQLN